MDRIARLVHFVHFFDSLRNELDILQDTALSMLETWHRQALTAASCRD
jgi:hypothetical protein